MTAAAASGRRAGLAIAGHRVRRRWLALLIGLVAIAILLAVEVPQYISSGSQTTIWQKITSGIADGIVPKQTALEAFAYLYKVDIPDVEMLPARPPPTAWRSPS